MENANVAISKLNEDLQNVNQWLQFSKLSLNTSKSKAMLISPKPIDTSQFIIQIDGSKIDFVTCIKYLGVQLDSKLTLNEYHQALLSRLNREFYILKRCSNKLNSQSKQIFIKSIVFPSLNYCSSVLFLLNSTQIDSLQKVMHRFMRLILKVDYRAPRKKMLQDLGWLSVNQLIIYNTLILLHRSSIALTPYYLASQMVKRGDVHAHTLRSAGEYKEKPYFKHSSQNSLFFKGIQYFNNFRRYCSEKKDNDLNNGKSIKTLAKEYVKYAFPLS